MVVVSIPVLALATGVAWWAGAATPRLAPGGSFAYGGEPGTFFYGVSVRNAGHVPVTIIGAGRDGAGLELTSVEGPFPVTLRHDEELFVTLRYRVTDCAAVTSEPWPVPVTVERLWGAQTVHLALPPHFQSEWQGPEQPPLPVVRTGPVQWQRSQADLACAPPG
jgi:hypothetical protein